MGLDKIIKEARARGLSEKELFNILIQKGYSKKEVNDSLGRVPNNSAVETGHIAYYNFVDKFKMLFSQPTSFFDKVRENSISYSVGFFLAISGILIAISIAFTLIPFSFLSGNFLSGIFNFFSSFVFLILCFIFTFIHAVIIHFVAKIMHGEGRFIDSYNIVAYSLIPTVVLSSLIPIIGFLSIFYSIVIMIFGVSSLYKLSKRKSIFVVLMSFILPLIFIILLIGYFYILMVRGGGPW